MNRTNRRAIPVEGKRFIGCLFLLLVSAPASAQVPGAPPSGVSQGTIEESAVGGAIENEVSVLSGFMEPFDYDPQGRKDPFAQPTVEKPLPPGMFHGPVLPLQKFRLEELSLIGVIWDVSKPRAMLKDPSGRVHVVGPNAKLGMQNGYIATIREGEIVVIETYEEDGKLFSSARIVKLAGGEKTAVR